MLAGRSGPSDGGWQTKGIQKSVLPAGIPMARFCSWAHQSAGCGHAWVSWAPPYASEMAALIVNGACCSSAGWPFSNIRHPQRSLHQSCSLTSSTPTMVQAAQLFHCIHHFVASTVACPQKSAERRTTHFCHLSVFSWHWLPVWIWVQCTKHLVMDSEDWMWCDSSLTWLPHFSSLTCAFDITTTQWRKVGNWVRTRQPWLFLCRFSGCTVSLIPQLCYWITNKAWAWLPHC